MLKLEQHTSEKFDSLQDAEFYLRDHGWKPFHAGLWRHVQRPGLSREIRYPDQKCFVIVESKYVSV